MIERYFVILSETSTQYRIRPNPDTNDGYKGGAVLEYSDDTEWQGYVHLCPTVFEDLAEAFAEIAATIKPKD